MKTEFLIPLIPAEIMIRIESYSSADSDVSIFAPRDIVITEEEYKDLPDTVKACFSREAQSDYLFDPTLYRPGKLQCTIDYPLSTPCHFDIDVPDDIFDVTVVLDQYCEKYRQIYQEESDSMTKCVQPNPRLINRGTSDGAWGIWGHELGDLVIEGMDLDLVTGKLEVIVGS